MTWAYTILLSWEGTLKNKKKLMPVQIMNNAGINIVTNVSIFSHSASMNSIFNENIEMNNGSYT